MIKKNINVGDVFEIRFNSEHKKYMQFIFRDPLQMNTEVIRVFKKLYPIVKQPGIIDIVNDEIDFYAHCILKLAITKNAWKKVGNCSVVGNLNSIFFRVSGDSGLKLGQEPVKVSQKWYVWKLGDDKIVPVGKLEGVYKHAELGVVVPAYMIMHRMITGKYKFAYPGL